MGNSINGIRKLRKKRKNTIPEPSGPPPNVRRISCDICYSMTDDSRKCKICTYKACKTCIDNWVKRSSDCPGCRNSESWDDVIYPYISNNNRRSIEEEVAHFIRTFSMSQSHITEGIITEEDDIPLDQPIRIFISIPPVPVYTIYSPPLMAPRGNVPTSPDEQ